MMRRIVIAAVVLVLLSVSYLAWRHMSPHNAGIQPDDLVYFVESLTPAQIAELEQKSTTNPEDLQIRNRLLNAYFTARDNASREARRRHIFWIIKHHPESPIVGMPEAGLNPIEDKEAYAEAKRLWREQAEKFPSDTKVLSNAAAFFSIDDSSLAEEYLNKCAALEPENPKWPKKLGQLQQLNANTSQSPEQGQAALTAIEKAMALSNKDDRADLFESAAMAAFSAGQFDKAKSYAAELLKNCGSPSGWNYGNAIHHGNLILGRVALKDGDLAKAKEYLISSGKTSGSPQLDSFGPNMSLAKDLLEKGERDVVLEYLRQCGNFWERDELRQWTAEIQAGRIPDFGANMDY